MIGIELASAAIVAIYLGVKLLVGSAPRTFIARMGLLSIAAWLAENTIIEAYGFYAYSSEWSIFVDRVPLMVILIWPVVVHSAWDLARHLVPQSSRTVPVIAGLIVLADASLIEPISVAAGLWHWTEPGVFDVPLIGVTGWALFALVAVWWFESSSRNLNIAVVAVAPLATHAALLGLWWLAFRWFHGPVPALPWTIATWVGSLALTAASLRRKTRLRVPLGDMLLRAPGAAFFFVLLALYVGDSVLVAYALAFAPPYLSLIAVAGDRSGHTRAA